MKNNIQTLVDENFGKFPETFQQLEGFYKAHVSGKTILVIGAGRNTIDAAQGMIPLFTVFAKNLGNEAAKK